MSGNVKKYKKDKGYESINRNMLQDVDNLSLQAIGLLSNLTSMPESWTTYKTELYKRFAKNGRTSVQNAWNELVENKYIVQLRKRNGKKYDYIYYHSQEPFSSEDIKEIERLEGVSIWNGKSAKTNKTNTPSNVEKQQSKNNGSSNVDYQQSKMDSSKPTDINLITEEIDNKDLDTIDTNDPKSDNKNKYSKAKEEYIKKAFFQNNEFIPEKLRSVFETFCTTVEQAEAHFGSILGAKKEVSLMYNVPITFEDHPELLNEIINTYVRSLRKIEKEKDVKNPDGYIYMAIRNMLDKEMSLIFEKPTNDAVQFPKRDTSFYYDWLNEDNEEEDTSITF